MEKETLIFATCDEQGHYKGIDIFDSTEVVAMGMENEEGTYILEYVNEGVNQQLFYLEYVRIQFKHYIIA